MPAGSQVTNPDIDTFSGMSRRRQLALGGSILALCIGSNALAQQVQTVEPGASLPSQFTQEAGETVETGVVATGSPTATATVTSIPSGAIKQTAEGEHEQGGGATVHSLDLANAGSVSILASAIAQNDDGQANGHAQLRDGITQKISVPNGASAATARNSGLLTISAEANGTGTDFNGALAGRAVADLIGGFHQEASVEGSGDGSATASVENGGIYEGSSVATAEAEGDVEAQATTQEVIFMRAQANGAGDGAALANLANSGELDFSSEVSGLSTLGNATASALTGGGHHGLVHVRAAANGVGDDSATVLFTNDVAGSLLVDASAVATALQQAEATALADGALVMKGQASGQDEGDVLITLDNAGLIQIGAASLAQSTGLAGGANATTTLNSAIVEIAEAGGPEHNPVRNGSSNIVNRASGNIAIAGSASASASGAAAAFSQLVAAILQEAELAGGAKTRFANEGSVAVTGNALATGEAALSSTSVGAIEHEIFGAASAGGALSVFDNAGSVNVAASADARGTSSAEADASAYGFKVWGEPVAIALNNSGALLIASSAFAAGGAASADALGMIIRADFDPTVTLPEDEEEHGHGGDEGHSPDNGQNGHGGEDEGGPVVWEEEASNTISGTLTNSGLLSVTALADSDASLATATGVLFKSAVNNAELVNSGTILATAMSNGGSAGATAIALTDFPESPILSGAGDIFTLVNDGGTIIARQSSDLGASWQRGTAIDTSIAPNPVDILLEGDGAIYGNIDLSGDDWIFVRSGTSLFDGLINPEAALEGGLLIDAGGTLVLADPRHANPAYDGPAGGHVEYFETTSSSTLAYELPVIVDGEALPAGSYPQLFADVAVLGGTLQVRPNSPNGLYDDVYVYQDIIDANLRLGTFSAVETFGGSPLFAPVAYYDDADNVDLVISRVAFGDVAGLAFNQSATGTGIEGDYDPLEGGAYGDLLAHLFSLDASDYAAALDQVSGDQYAGFVQNLRDASLHVAELVAGQLDCTITSREGLEYCRHPDQGLRLFALGGFDDSRVDGDGNASGYEAEGNFAAIGFDYSFGNVSLGGFGGYRDVDMLFGRNSGRIEADGFQLGLLGSYDIGDIYLRGHASYSWLDATSRRAVSLGPVAGPIGGAPDADILSLYGEAGGRLALGASWLTPFVAVDFARISLDGFTESGVSGVNLDLPGQSDSQTSVLAGLKWAGVLGPITPEAKLVYRHDLGDPFLTSTARFADAPGQSYFTVRSPDAGQDSLLAGFSLAANLTQQLTARLGYQWRFSEAVDDNAFYGSLVMRFGGPATDQPSLPDPEKKSAPGDTALRLGFDMQAIYSDNIFATRNDRVDDFIIAIRPSARFKIGNRASYLELGGIGYLARNAEVESENFSDWTVDLASRLKLNDSASLILDGEYRWAHEARTSPEAVFGLTPTQYERGRAVAGLLLNDGPLSARFAGSLTRHDYENAATLTGLINNDDRDRTAAEFISRVGYEIAPKTDFFVQASLDDTRYKSEFDDFGYQRNSHGLAAVLGLSSDLGNGFSGEIFGGLLQRSYADADFADTNSFDLGVLLDWSGRNSTARLRVDRSIEETTYIASSSYLLTNGSLSFSTAVGPRLAAGVTLGGAQYSYSEIDRSEFVISSDVWSRYWLNQHIFAGVGYTFTERSSNAAGFDYDENRFLLTVGSQLRPRYLDGAGSLDWSGGEAAPGGAYAALLLGHGMLVSGVEGPRDLQALSIADFGDEGAGYGLAFGYGKTFDPVYLGLEVAGTLDGPSWQHGGERNFGVAKDNDIELAARIGFVTRSDALVYGRFGVASAKFTTDYATTSTAATKEGRTTGLNLGLGLETAVSGRNFLRAEYVVTGYRDYDVPLANGQGDNFSSVESQFRLGFGMRFGATGEKDEAEVTDFGGAYAGLIFGHGTLATHTIGERVGQAPLDASRASHGGVLGAVAGYGLLAGGFYIGGEVQADFSSINWNLQGSPDGRNYRSGHAYSFGAASRIGHLISPNALAFASLGVVRTRFDTRYDFGGISVHSNDTRTGLQLGGGLETGLGENTRLRAEYLVNRYGEYSVTYSQGTETFDHSESLFRIGVLFDL